MATGFLSDAELDALRSWPSEIARSDLAAHFTLDRDAIRWIRSHRNPSTQLALAIQLTALALLGFVPDISGTPTAVVAFLADQVDVPSTVVGEYAPSDRVRQQHTAAVIQRLGWSVCGPGEWKRLGDWLVARAREHDAPSVLFRQALTHLRSERIVRPGLDRLMRAVATARTTAAEELYRLLRPVFTPQLREQLDALVDTDEALGTASLVWLHDGATSASPAAVKTEIAKLDYVRHIGADRLDLSVIATDRRRQLAQVARRSTPATLRRMNPERRHPLLAAALFEAYRDLTDEVVLLFDQALSGVDSRTRRQVRDLQLDTLSANEQRLELLDDILDVLLDESLDNVEVGKALRGIDIERLNRAVRPLSERHPPRDGGQMELLEARYSQLRSFTPHVLGALNFHASIESSETLDAVRLLQRLNTAHQRHVPAGAPTGFVPARWRSYLDQAATAGDASRYRHYWELAVLFALRAGLRSGEIWVDGSRRYANPTTYLIPTDDWAYVRDEALADSGKPDTFAEELTRIEADTGRLLDDLETMLDDPETPVSIDDHGQLRLHRLSAERTPSHVTDQAEQLVSRLPTVPLSELLIEIDQATEFTRHLTHAAGSQPRHPNLEHRRNLYAAMLAQACNFGITRMAELCGISTDTLAWTTRWYLREDTLRAANAAIVNAHHRHPLARVWGGGTLSSSDGLRLPIRGRSLTARAMSRYFVDQGGTSYTHVSDQHTTYGTQMIVTTDRDATYVLDEILGNATDLPISEHTTDTHGQTLLTFALFDLVGLRLSPRIAKPTKQRLWRPHPPSHYRQWPTAGLLLAHPVQTGLIDQHWDDLLRIAWSIKTGHVTAALLTTRLQAGARQHPLAKALIEYGKLQRTNHTLRWFTDEAFRRRIGRQLNRGESLNALRRYLFFAHRSEITHRHLDDQTTQAHCHTLVTNACVLWTTHYLDHAIAAHRAERRPLDDRTVAHLSPARYHHINPYGTYNFDVRRILDQQRPRPLRPVAPS
ncbi:MAG: Tn3 family transposase [Acidimicrobiia bacterium]|nr:Tn3 family transposase [Acidimicrobiia bacterium]MDH5615060.1 Tn3 family transposase [Acidimicrobiia bacterium]